MTLQGVEAVIRNLQKSNKALAAGTERGVKLAGAHLLKESNKLVPVDTGNLKASGTVTAASKGYDTQVYVQYTAGYAIFVHENVQMKLRGQPRPGGAGRYWDPQGRGQSKFLETAARNEKDRCREIIREAARIK